MAKTAPVSVPQLEVGLVCDAATSPSGVHGLTDLFNYAGTIAARRRGAGSNVTRDIAAGQDDATHAIRSVHWRADESTDGEVRCVYDTHPGAPHAPALLVIPGNVEAPLPVERERPLEAWLRTQHASGVVLAAVCGGVFILARTGLLDGRQATTHWAFNETFAAQFPQVLTETDRMVIDYGDVMTGGGVLAWADLGLRLTERFLGPTVMHETARFMLVDPPRREQRF